MTAQTVNGAVAVRDKQDKVIHWLRAQQDDIAMAAASHIRPSAVVRVAQGALRRNEKLALAAIANPQSLLYALLDAARLGHEPDTDDYYLVPFGNEVTGIEGYKGIIERMYRAGGVSSVVAEVVRQRDYYRQRGSTAPPEHEYDDFADPAERGELKGAYAYAVLPDGRCSYVVRMGRAEIMRHKAKSRGSDKSDSPWKQWEEAMWKKTVLRGLEPYVPTSTEYRTAPAAIAAPVALQAPSASPRPVTAAEPVEGEIVDDAPAAGRPAADEPVTRAQLTKIGAIFTEFGFATAERAQRLGVVARVVRRDIGSTKELTKDEASALIDTLEQFSDRGALIEAMASEADHA
jgi:recombination protein RecT